MCVEEWSTGSVFLTGSRPLSRLAEKYSCIIILVDNHPRQLNRDHHQTGPPQASTVGHRRVVYSLHGALSKHCCMSCRHTGKCVCNYNLDHMSILPLPISSYPQAYPQAYPHSYPPHYPYPDPCARLACSIQCMYGMHLHRKCLPFARSLLRFSRCPTTDICTSFRHLEGLTGRAPHSSSEISCHISFARDIASEPAGYETFEFGVRTVSHLNLGSRRVCMRAELRL